MLIKLNNINIEYIFIFKLLPDSDHREVDRHATHPINVQNIMNKKFISSRINCYTPVVYVSKAICLLINLSEKLRYFTGFVVDHNNNK